MKEDDHIISSAFLFGNTNSFFGTLQKLGIEVTFVDATEARFVENAIQKNTKLVFVETIANPVTQVADLKAIGQLCKTKNLIYCVDNTMTSPCLFLPKSVGASLIVNSLTKYIGGHGNALGGAITDTGLYNWSSFENIYDTYRNEEPELWGITQIKKKGLRDMGASLGPEAAHHLAIGSETLSLRIKKACKNALALAEFCQKHSKIKQTYYPGFFRSPTTRAGATTFLNNLDQFLALIWQMTWTASNFSMQWITLFLPAISATTELSRFLLLTLFITKWVRSAEPQWVSLIQ
ncbi:MAG: hypothetical protein CM1200mP40_14410 [Gammaproteobacteria bacterium]|nr:MAG: hypothetical protein CM1200mP40_14410 [Gammaproteobacteria bacterium]